MTDKNSTQSDSQEASYPKRMKLPIEASKTMSGPYNTSIQSLSEAVSQSRESGLSPELVLSRMADMVRDLQEFDFSDDSESFYALAIEVAALAVRVAEEGRGAGKGSPRIPPTHFVLPRAKFTMVKESDFFWSQFEDQFEDPGNWVPVHAQSVEHAREIGSWLNPVDGSAMRQEGEVLRTSPLPRFMHPEDVRLFFCSHDS